MIKLCMIIDGSPIYNGGFSQRVKRELELISNFEGLQIYVLLLSSLRDKLNTKEYVKRTKDLMGKLNVKKIKMINMIPDSHFKNKDFIDKYYVQRIKRFLIKNNIDIMLAENLYCGWLSYLSKKTLNIPYIFDYHGVVPEEKVYFGFIKKESDEYNKIKLQEKYIIENAKNVICVSNRFKDYIISNFSILDKKIKVVPCCIDNYDYAFSENTRNEIRDKLNISDKKVIIYSGTILKYQCVEEMIRFFSKIQHKDSFYFIFLSANSNKNAINELFKKYDILENKYYIDSVDHSKVYDYYFASDFGIIIREDELLNNVSSPTKIPEYLVSGLPIICTNNIGDIMEIPSEKLILNYDDIDSEKIDNINFDFFDNSIDKRIENLNICKNYINKKFKWATYKKVYEEMLNCKEI